MEGRGHLVDTGMREERKVVTALFADVVGSTALAERFDPEDTVEIVGGAVSLMVEAVEGFGGTVKDLAGDGVLALFGAPDAHEDDPERAVRAGLRIVEAIREHEADVCRGWNLDEFGVRVGIETGLVVLGSVGAGSRVEYGATGDALNTAARLQSHADPYGVLVGPATHRLIEPIFRWGERHELELKGKAEPVTAFEVAGVRPRPGKLRGLAGATAPLLGRGAELAVGLEAAEQVLAGRGGVLIVEGEPGVGKTRLVAEIRSGLSGRAVRWLDGQCVSYGQTLPYWPIRDLVRAWIGVTPADPPDRLRERLRERAAIFDRPDEVVPYLAAMLDVLDPGTERAIDALSPEARAFRTTEAVTALIRGLARERPLIVAIDDLQWADATSVQLLERLFPLADEERTLFVLALRPEPDHPSTRLRAEAGRAHPGRVGVITLEALPSDADRDLLHALVGDGTLPIEVERRIIRTAEGNPFYLEELVRSLVEAGALVAEGEGWRFEPGETVDIPPTVERVIVARIDRLSASARDTIQAASVLGRRFGSELLEAVAAGVLGVALAELVSMDLLREEGQGGYRFKHGLIQEACYNNMLKRRRRELHARAAEALESALGDRPEPYFGVLAQHHRGAGDLERSLRFFELAAAEAQRVYAVEEAVGHYDAALEVSEALGSDRTPELLLRRGRVLVQAGQLASARRDLEAALERARATDDRALEVDAMNELGFLLAGAVNYREALPLLERSLSAAGRIGSREAEVAAASRLSIVYTNLLRLDLAVERAQRARALAREVGDDRSVAMAMDALQVASVMVGDMATVEEVSPALVRIHRERGDLWYLQFALYQWAWVDMAAGRWDAAERRFAEALEVNRRIGDRANEPVMLSSLAWVARARGAYGVAIELGRRAVQIAEEVGHTEFLAWSTQHLGWTLLEVFNVAGAVEQLERSLRAAEEAGGRIEIVRAACHLPLARWLAGERSRALEEAALAERLLAETSAPPGRAYLQGADGPIALANLQIAAGGAAGALDLVGPVWEAAVLTGWQEVAAGAALAIGRARVRLGPSEEMNALELAAERAERAGVPGLAWRAHAELAGAGPPDARSVHRARAAELIQTLSATIEDVTMRRTFLERATAQLSGGGWG